MSRFRPRSSPSGVALEPLRHAPAVAVPAGRVAQAELPAAPLPAPQRPASVVQRIGFWILCAYVISAVLNEWAIRLMDTKAYISVVALFLLPVVWLASGAAFRGFSHTVGWLWAGFLFWMLAATPFSIWRGGSFDLLLNYIPRSYMLFFYVTALAVSLRRCRQLMYANIAVSFVILLTCVVFGTYSEDGRYYVPGGAGFFQNSNELAMDLLLMVSQFVYLFSQKSRVGKILAVTGIAGSALYIIRTGSRGVLIGAIAYGIVLLYVSRHRVRVLAACAALGAAAFLLAPSSALDRLLTLVDEPTGLSSELSALGSQATRIMLLKRSISETVQHPLFGVGPGQFAVAVAEEAKRKGEWAQWLGTHNSYTQVSSECGIPAFLCYFAVVIACLAMNLKMWKRFRNQPDRADITLLSVALLSGSVVYAVCAFFFHMAYSGTLPFYAGQTLALRLAANRIERVG